MSRGDICNELEKYRAKQRRNPQRSGTSKKHGKLKVTVLSTTDLTGIQRKQRELYAIGFTRHSGRNQGPPISPWYMLGL